METWVTQLDKLVIPEGAGFTEDDKPFIEGKLRQLLPANRPGYFRGQPQAICQRLLALFTSTGQGNGNAVQGSAVSMQALVPHGQPIAVGNQVQQPVPLQPLLARYNQAQQQLDLGMDMYVKLFCEALYAVAHHQSHASTHYTIVSTHQHREIRNGRPYRGSTVDIIRDYPALRDAISQHGIAARYGVDVSTMSPAAEPLAQFVFAHQGKF